MPVKKMCPRCRKVIEITQKRCVDCTAKSNKDYDKTRRDRKSKAFYNSGEWLHTRGKVLSDWHGLDMYELKVNGKVVYADTVHHIEELKENPSRALDLTNLIPLSSGTHSMIHREYEHGDKAKMQRILFECVKG